MLDQVSALPPGPARDRRALELLTDTTLDQPGLMALAFGAVNAPDDHPTGVEDVVVLIADGFGEGFNGPIVVLFEAPDAVRAATGASGTITGLDDVALDNALPVYLALVVGLALVLLVPVFRSVLVPLVGVLGFLPTTGASLGATVAAFQGVGRPTRSTSTPPVR